MTTAADMIERLRVKYSTDKGEWATFAEISAPGEKHGVKADRRIDFLALRLWGRSTLVAVEVKVSRADWLAELADPDKREYFERRANAFWIAAAKGVVEVEELPDGVGLFVTHGSRLRIVRAARYYR